MIKDFHQWLNKQPAKYIISGQGNHEVGVQSNFQLAKSLAQEACPNVHFVEHELIEIEGVRIFYSAWTPWFYNWAYNASRSLEDAQHFQRPYIKDMWDSIPDDIDILACHGPTHGINDLVYQIDGVTPKERVGCWHLAEKFDKSRATTFICGHIHSGHGYKYFNDKHYYNVSVCGETYQVDYEPTVIEYEKSI